MWCLIISHYTRSIHDCCSAGLGVVKTDDELDDLVRKLAPGSGFVYCPGVLCDAYKDFYKVIRYHSNVLKFYVITLPTEQYESKDCCLWHKAHQWSVFKAKVDLKDICTNCKNIAS